MESTADILLAHKRKLLEELDQAKARVAAIEAEIASANSALGSVPWPAEKPAPAMPSPEGRKMSVKAMVVDALATRFPHGASVHDLLDCFATVYGRDDVARTSLSPQLTALKNERKIKRDGMTWLADNG